MVKGEPVTFGFDGSRRRRDTTTDATALVGCTVSDGHLFVPLTDAGYTIWEAPPRVRDWEIPTAAVDTAVREVLGRFNVQAFYCDPTLWESFVAAWEGDYGHGMRIKASQAHPFTWWPGPKRVTYTVERFRQAVLGAELTHDGNPTLRAHVLNARRAPNAYGVTIRKEHPTSDRKIDAAMAAAMAWQARLDVVAAGPADEGRRPGRVVGWG